VSAAYGVIPILYEDAPNYMRNKPQRAHSRSISSEKDTKKERKKERKKENLAQAHKEMV
jgi:hypothetical protein